MANDVLLDWDIHGVAGDYTFGYALIDGRLGLSIVVKQDDGAPFKISIRQSECELESHEMPSDGVEFVGGRPLAVMRQAEELFSRMLLADPALALARRIADRLESIE